MQLAQQIQEVRVLGNEVGNQVSYPEINSDIGPQIASEPVVIETIHPVSYALIIARVALAITGLLIARRGGREG